MAHVIEPATSGRAKCRGCRRAIARGELRLGERLPNPYADEGDMTLWFHLRCGAFKRPEVLLEALREPPDDVEDRDRLVKDAELGLEHRRLPRLDGCQRSPSGRARCRSCRELIEKGRWRIGLVYYDEGVFSPSGNIHLGCAAEYLGTSQIRERLLHFVPDLSADDLGEIDAELSGD